MSNTIELELLWVWGLHSHTQLSELEIFALAIFVCAKYPAPLAKHCRYLTIAANILEVGSETEELQWGFYSGKELGGLLFVSPTLRALAIVLFREHPIGVVLDLLPGIFKKIKL